MSEPLKEQAEQRLIESWDRWNQIGKKPLQTPDTDVLIYLGNTGKYITETTTRACAEEFISKVFINDPPRCIRLENTAVCVYDISAVQLKPLCGGSWE